MPIYEYKCNQCGTVDEYLLPVDGVPTECSRCSSSDLEKLHSIPSILTGGSSEGRSRTIVQDMPDGSKRIEHQSDEARSSGAIAPCGHGRIYTATKSSEMGESLRQLERARREISNALKSK